MLEFLRQFGRGVSDAWRRLSLSARVQMIAAALLTTLFLVSVVVVGSRPQFVELYSGLSAQDAGTIVTWLSDNGIEHQEREGGATIMVPVQHRSRARLALLDQGVPSSYSGGVGFEIFDAQDLTTNRRTQDINYQRAVQGTLQRMLNEFEFVKSSSVFIQEAERKPFRSEQQPSEAAVTVSLARDVSKSETEAMLGIITRFGGANLTRQNVTLVDTTGRVLYMAKDDAVASLAADKLEAMAEYEEYFRAKISTALEAAGHRAVVTVASKMNWADEEKTSRQVIEGALLSEETSEETSDSMEGPPEGPPGLSANPPEGGSAGARSGTKTTVETTLTNYDPSETVTTTRTPGGTFDGISVTVLVDNAYEQVADAQGNTAPEPRPLTPEQITNLNGLVMGAVGTYAKVEDVKVLNHPFQTAALVAAVQTATAAPATGLLQTRMLVTSLQVLAAIVAFFALRFFMRRALVQPSEEAEEMVELPEASREDTRRAEIASEIERLAREDPNSVAALLRSWMAQE
ncbi:MAG: flagellar basal-body MS-ring/collar protein FliF [Candidatus Hydrogenedentota bacterium]